MVGSVILADFVAKDAKTNIGGLGIRGEKAIPGIDEMVGVGRIELPTSCSQSRRPTAGLHPECRFNLIMCGRARKAESSINH